jgi:hypothetical protein
VTSTPAPFDPDAVLGIVSVTAAITLGEVRYSHTEGVSAHHWRDGSEEFRDMVRATARDRLGHCLVRELPVEITEPPANEDATPGT